MGVGHLVIDHTIYTCMHSMERPEEEVLLPQLLIALNILVIWHWLVYKFTTRWGACRCWEPSWLHMPRFPRVGAHRRSNSLTGRPTRSFPLNRSLTYMFDSELKLMYMPLPGVQLTINCNNTCSNACRKIYVDAFYCTLFDTYSLCKRI